MKKILKNIIFIAFIMLSIYFCIRFPKDIGTAVSTSADRCINIIIPSMFIFMCITSATVSSGIHNIISIPLAPIAKYIFRLRTNEVGIFILSLVSGYPTGIKLITDSFRKKEISKEKFDRLSCFCFAGGPAFISGTVSGILYSGTSAGMLCFLAITAGNILTAAVSGFFLPLPKKTICSTKTNISAECLINSTLSSARAIFHMCVMITTFGGIYKILELSGITNGLSVIISNILGTDASYIKTVISGIFEISNIVNMPQNNIALLPVTAAMLSFGGICVLIQVIVISDGLLNIKKFLISRIFAAAASAFFCKLFSRFFNLGTVDVFKPTITNSNNGYLPAILLLLMTLMLLSLSKSYGQSNKKMI